MNGDNNTEDKKAKTKPNEGENAETSILKQDDKDSICNEVKSEGAELLEKISPSNKEKFFEAAMSMSMERFVGSPISLLESKMTEKHIDKILDLKEKHDDKVFKDTQQSRKFQLTYVLVGAIIFVFLTLFLVGKDTELFKEILKLFITFVGGMGAGFGIKHYMEK